MQNVNRFHLLPSSWRGEDASPFADEYRRAFATAVELYVVSAFLTEWPSDLELNPQCKRFRMVIGTDFGTTRRAAVVAALEWLPKRFSGELRAFNQKGVTFHPKAVLWREAGGKTFLLLGSSNLTRAAFESNVEANVTIELTRTEYAGTYAWLQRLTDKSLKVNSAWLKKYVEAPKRGGGGGKGKAATEPEDDEPPLFDFSLALTSKSDKRAFAERLEARRVQRAYFDAHSKEALLQVLRTAARKRTWAESDNLTLYNNLTRLWGEDETTRMGGGQWVIRGKHTDHQELARSVVAVCDAESVDKDDVVLREKDRLRSLGISTRSAAFTELLCHLFPSRYPILDEPVRRWRSHVGFDYRVRGTEGERYIRLAEAMRAALNDAGPTELGLQNLAELDTLIWFKFG